MSHSRRLTILGLGVAALAASVAGLARAAPTPGEDLPPVVRRVPEHPPSILRGCSAADQGLVVGRIARAIDIGAPTYNRGDFRGCYEVYERTARSIEQALPPTCPGPAAALRQGRDRADAASSDHARAWAMRDAFDGLLLVIERARRAP